MRARHARWFTTAYFHRPEDLRAEVEGAGLAVEGVYGLEGPGSLLIDMSSISPVVTKTLSDQVKAKGATMLDAPVSGGDVGAINGTLSIMVGGKQDVFERCKPLFEAVGKTSEGQWRRIFRDACQRPAGARERSRPYEGCPASKRAPARRFRRRRSWSAPDRSQRARERAERERTGVRAWLGSRLRAPIVGLMVFEWGMDISGQSSGLQTGELGRVNGETISYQAYSAAYQELYNQARAQSGADLSPEQVKQLEGLLINYHNSVSERALNAANGAFLQTEVRATHDRLTGIANRRRFDLP